MFEKKSKYNSALGASEFQYNTTCCTLFYYKVFIFDNFLELNLRSQFHEQSSTTLYIHISILHLFCGKKFLPICYENLLEVRSC